AGPIRVLVINHTIAPTDSLAVRQALAAAVDREALLTVLGNTGQMLRSPIPPGFLGASTPFAAAGDPQTAVQLLTEAGYSGAAPLEVEISHPSDRYGDTAIAPVAAISDQWEATGLIQVETRTTEWDTYIPQLLAGTFHEIALLGWSVDYFDPNPFVEPFTAFGGLGTNISDPDTGKPTEGLSHPELLDLVGAAASELDQTRRSELYLEIQDLWASDVVTIPLWWEPAWVFYRDGVTSRGESPFSEALNIGPTGFLDYSRLRSG
ncbi:MAG: ABC transporter substrate-binding protein, partial [Acidimicrobiia bacterium]